MKTFPPGTRIGRYEIAGRPLMGGMGIVYLCLDTETDRPVALKTFRPKLLPNRAARDRFLREGTTWVDLGAHPHVVQCYDVLYIDSEVYLVLELVAKEQGRDDASLRSWLTPGQPLPLEQVLLFALQIARGMSHAAVTIPGFVHRDLKPENILIGADYLSRAPVNRVRVTDFGLATILQETARYLDNVTTSDMRHAIRNPNRLPPVRRGCPPARVLRHTRRVESVQKVDAGGRRPGPVEFSLRTTHNAEQRTCRCVAPSVSVGSAREKVPPPVHCPDQPWLARVGLQLVAQAVDVRAHDVLGLFHVHVVAQGGLGQCVAG